MFERLMKTRPGHLIVASTLDAMDVIRGRRDPLTPPRRMIFIGAGDFRATGEEFKNYFVDLGGLTPADDVLDVGCGIGRMAAPLAGWLTGRYEGFDVVPAGIEWCRRSITPQHSNFRFQVADLFNKKYNPGATERAESFRFPYPEDSFDFVLLTSVFTHLLPDAVEGYLREIRRVLRADGTVFATFFLIDAESLAGIRGAASQFAFKKSDGYWTTSRQVPESAVAYDIRQVESLYRDHDLPISSVRRGFWSGCEGLSLQDIVIATGRPDRTSARGS